MKRTVKRILSELLRDSSKSDRKLAKVLGVSQPTVSRLRNKLIKDGLIKNFSVTPNLYALGFELIAITSFTSKTSKEIIERTKKWTMSKPNVLFAARSEGNRRNAVVVSIHKNYTDYYSFMLEVKGEVGADATDYETLLIPLGGVIIKPFSLKYIAEALEKSKD